MQCQGMSRRDELISPVLSPPMAKARPPPCPSMACFGGMASPEPTPGSRDPIQPPRLARQRCSQAAARLRRRVTETAMCWEGHRAVSTEDKDLRQALCTVLYSSRGPASCTHCSHIPSGGHDTGTGLLSWEETQTARLPWPRQRHLWAPEVTLLLPRSGMTHSSHDAPFLPQALVATVRVTELHLGHQEKTYSRWSPGGKGLHHV